MPCAKSDNNTCGDCTVINFATLRACFEIKRIEGPMPGNLCKSEQASLIVAGPGIPMRIGNSFPAARTRFFPFQAQLAPRNRIAFQCTFSDPSRLAKRIFCAQGFGYFKIWLISGTTLRMTSHPNAPDTMFLQKTSFQRSEANYQTPQSA